MNTKIRVGITSFGSNTAIGVAKVLMSTYGNIEIIGIDSNPIDETTGYTFADYFHQVPLASQSSEYLVALNEIIDSRKLSVLIPIHDLELMILSKNLNEINCRVAVNSERIIEICNDKIRQMIMRPNLLRCQTMGLKKSQKTLPL